MFRKESVLNDTPQGDVVLMRRPQEESVLNDPPHLENKQMGGPEAGRVRVGGGVGIRFGAQATANPTANPSQANLTTPRLHPPNATL